MSIFPLPPTDDALDIPSAKRAKVTESKIGVYETFVVGSFCAYS